jgi:hypothetical protein
MIEQWIIEVHLRHPHWKAVDHYMSVERLEDISREETVVHTGVLVLLELGQLVLPDVHHSYRCCDGAGRSFVGLGVDMESAGAQLFEGTGPSL